MGLRTEEYDLLEKIYGLENEKDLVNYLKMVEEVNTVFTLKVKLMLKLEFGEKP